MVFECLKAVKSQPTTMYQCTKHNSRTYREWEWICEMKTFQCMHLSESNIWCDFVKLIIPTSLSIWIIFPNDNEFSLSISRIYLPWLLTYPVQEFTFTGVDCFLCCYFCLLHPSLLIIDIHLPYLLNIYKSYNIEHGFLPSMNYYKFAQIWWYFNSSRGRTNTYAHIL